MNFDPNHINEYSIEELIQFMEKDGFSMNDFRSAGLFHTKQSELTAYLERKQEALKQEGTIWNQAVQSNTIEAYELYLSRYPSGSHLLDAELAINRIKALRQQFEDDLRYEMSQEPYLYSASVMKQLLGTDNFSQMTSIQDSSSQDQQQFEMRAWQKFLGQHMRIDYNWLYENGILPQNRPDLRKAITRADFQMPQLKIEELGDFPTDRMDVYFLGMPGSGKSCVLSGIINAMEGKGVVRYIPQFTTNGVDNCMLYYNELLRSISEHKVPMSTGTETISFLKLDVGSVNEKKNRITIVELSGEAFNRIAQANMSGENVWNQLGAGRCLKNNNSKLLFFLVDYLTVAGLNPRFSAIDQQIMLNNALTVLTSDGPNANDRSQGCTLSKVQSVAVIVTKSDLIPEVTTPAERNEKAKALLKNGFKNFMNNLTSYCSKFGINKAVHFQPYVMTFSLGDFYVGNTVDYNPEDSNVLVEFIRDATAKESTSLSDIFNRK